MVLELELALYLVEVSENDHNANQTINSHQFKCVTAYCTHATAIAYY
jgi:TorA maturation chaperone TorD